VINGASITESTHIVVAEVDENPDLYDVLASREKQKAPAPRGLLQ
jgi:hypothetical protein